MRRVEQWVKTAGTRMLFIYGANDPWSTTAYDVKATNDAHRLVVAGPAGDHVAGIFDLPEDQFLFAWATVNRWLGDSTASVTRARAKRASPRFDRPTKAELFLR